jgi:alginate O-acetyltransferase complex protein AlgJ
MKNSIKIVYIIVFILLIGGVAVSSLLDYGKADVETFVKMEKRNPTTKPVWIWERENVEKYFNEINSWINDNFAFRTQMIQYYSSLLYLGGVSSNPQKIIVGKNNFLFLGNSFNEVMDQVTGKILFDEQQLTKWKSSFQLRSKYLDLLGIPFYAVMVPKKHTVYPEYLPDYIIPVKENVFDQILNSGPGFDLLHLKDTLISSKAYWGDLLYNKTDSHWSEIGAYIGYLKVINHLKSDFGDLAPIELDREDFLVRPHPGGQNKFILNLLVDMKDYDISINKSDKWKKNIVKTNYEGDTLPFDPFDHVKYHEKVIIYNPEKKYTLLMFEDSFSIRLSTFLNQSFGKIIYCHYSEPEAKEFIQLVERFKPDIVLYEFGEQSVALHDLGSNSLNAVIAGASFTSSSRKNGSSIYEKLRQVHQITNINQVDSSLYFLSTGNDPSLIFSEMDLDGDKFGAIKIDFTVPEQTTAQIFYLTNVAENFNGEQSLYLQAKKGRNVLVFYFPEKEVKNDRIRFDPGVVPGDYIIHSIEILQNKTN